MDESKNQTIRTLALQVKEHPDDSFSKFALALEFLKKEELQRARILFEDIHQKDPDYVGVYYHLGKLKERLGALEEAQQLYREGAKVAAEQKEKRTHKELKEALATVILEIEAQ